MSKEWSSSPREEALEIAYQTRKAILAGESDPVAILRACLVIANDLAKKSAIAWINQELSGYQNEPIPSYRVHSCPVFDQFGHHETFKEIKLNSPVHYLFSNERILHVSSSKVDSTLAAIVDRCFEFLNETITELQYSGIVEFLMEEIRRKTDEKLATYDTKITEETQSLYLSLTSTNPADWSKVGHSCRKILKLLADSVFQPSDEKYTTKDGKFSRSLSPVLLTDCTRSLIRIPHLMRRNSSELR